jgi:hypothetical protein
MAVARAVLAACCIATMLGSHARKLFININRGKSSEIAPKPPLPYPSMVPGTFEFLVVSPN